MWLWFGIKKEFEKIRDSFRKRDLILDEIKKEIVSKKEIELMIKEAVLNSRSQSQSSLKQSQSNFETKLINRVRKSKKSLVMSEIKKLEPTHTIIEIFEVIVKERGLCSKASFYRYISSLKSQSQEIEMRQKRRI